jgi:hypothetical protein
LSTDADWRDIDCYAFGRVNGRPYCDACNHPYCLAPGGSPKTCSFHVSRADFAAAQAKEKKLKKESL